MQPGAVIEGIAADAGDGAGDRDVGETGTAVEAALGDSGNTCFERGRFQAGAVGEGIAANAGDGAGDRDAY